MTQPIFHTDILILGAGIGGYQTYRALHKELKRRGLNKKITLVDQNNYFTFTPLLHEVASGSVEPDHTAIPLRELLHGTIHEFFKAAVTKINPEAKTVETDRGTISYEYCVMALGSTMNFFGTPGTDTNAYSVRTLREAMRLREAIIHKLEAGHTNLAISVVGGGYTGVEVAGEIAYFLQHDVKRLYPDDTTSMHLVEGNADVVTMLPEKARAGIKKQLEKLRVQIHFNARVKELTANEIKLQDGSSIPSHITIWAAGIGNVASKYITEDYCEKGRLVLNEFLQSKSPTLYGVGDVVLARNKNETVPHPQLGEAAHRHGDYVAKHIVASMRNKKMSIFHFKSAGSFMPIGEKYAVIVSGNFVLTGLFAWWIRRTIYVFFMPGILRKIQLVIDWTLKLFGFSYIIELDSKK